MSPVGSILSDPEEMSMPETPTPSCHWAKVPLEPAMTATADPAMIAASAFFLLTWVTVPFMRLHLYLWQRGSQSLVSDFFYPQTCADQDILRSYVTNRRPSPGVVDVAVHVLGSISGKKVSAG